MHRTGKVNEEFLLISKVKSENKLKTKTKLLAKSQQH